MENLHACKRLTVTAVGFKDGKMEMAQNEHETGVCNGKVGKCGCTHAEIRLLHLMPHPETVVLSHSPCMQCAAALVNAGVKEVAYEEPYRLRDGLYYLMDHGVSVKRIFPRP